MRRKTTFYPIMFVLAVCGTSAFADGLSREQGDAIISELRQIRQLLEKQQKPQPPSAPAPPERARLKLGKADFSVGRADAPVVIVEYTDYQCPFCNRFSTSTFPELKKQYIDSGKVRFVSRDYPLPFHQSALKAAQATRCAGDQGKFWQMKDALMANSSKLTPDLITSLARDAALDMGKFDDCMKSDKHLDEINGNVAVANAIGINGTPSFIIGRVSDDYLDGYLVVGARPFEDFENIIKRVQTEGKK